MTEHLGPVMVVFAIAMLSFSQYRLDQAAQPLRLRLAREGERLLQNPELSDESRQQVEYMLDTAFGMRAVLIGMIISMPIVAILIVVRQRFFERASVDSDCDPRVAAQLDELYRWHDRIVLANNPVLKSLVEAEFLICVLPAIVMRAVIMGKVSTAITKESVISKVEVGFGRLGFSDWSRSAHC